MTSHHHRFLTPLHCGVLCLVAGVARAEGENDRTNGFVEPALFVFVESDPNDSAKFEQYRDVPDGLTVPRFNLSWEQSKDLFGGGTWFELDAVDVVQKDQRLNLAFGSRGLWKGELSWSENPRRFGETAQMLHSYQGAGVFTLVDSLQSAYEAGGAVGPRTSPAPPDPWRGQTITRGVWDPGTKGAILRDALGQAPEIDVGYQRRTGAARFEFTPTKEWRIGVAAERQTRNGTKPQSQSFGFAAVTELAAPVDWKTDNLTLSTEYMRDLWVLGASYLWSSFDNDQDTLEWDNIVRLNDGSAGPGRGRYSLGTDNRMDQWKLWFGANLPGHTRINATASQSSTEQDDDFLPMTINSYILDRPHPEAPEDSAHARIDNDLLDFRINSRPLDWLRLKAWWRDYEQDNRTPRLEFDGYVSYDTSIGTNPTVSPTAWLRRANLPYGYERENLGALAGFEPADWAEISLSWEREDFARHHSPVEDSEQDTWKLSADFDVTDHLFLRASYSTQERRAPHYDVHYVEESFPDGESVIYGFNEGARKFLLTDRDRDTFSLIAEITPNEKFGIHVEAIRSQSDYFDPETGLRIGDSYTILQDQNADGTAEERIIRLSGRKDNDETSTTLGFSVNPTENWDIYVDHTWEKLDWRMASRYRPVTRIAGLDYGSDDPLNDWDNEVEDHYRTFTLGFGGTWADGGWSVRGDITHAQATGEMRTEFVPGGASASDTDLTKFPDLDNDFTIATLGFFRHLGNGWDFGVQYWYERWTYDEWQNDYNAPYIGNPDQEPAASDWIQLGLDFADYENHVITLLARYSF
jgi:MtrB/PioB family decaheme-associated outer membrane protein